MHLRRNVWIFSSLLCLALSACSPTPQSPPTISVNDTAATIVSMTFKAATQTAQARPAALPTFPAATPTLDKPRLFVNGNIDCRTGVHVNFKVVASFTPGMIVDMLGRDTADSAWLVLVPNTTTSCWVLAENSSPSGNFQALPEVSPQPIAQQIPPAPINFNWPFYCTYVSGALYKVTASLSWSDISTDVNGYRLYRGDTLIADLPASTPSFTDTAQVTIGTNLIYSVEAYNDAGVSPRHILTIPNICK